MQTQSDPIAALVVLALGSAAGAAIRALWAAIRASTRRLVYRGDLSLGAEVAIYGAVVLLSAMLLGAVGWLCVTHLKVGMGPYSTPGFLMLGVTAGLALGGWRGGGRPHE